MVVEIGAAAVATEKEGGCHVQTLNKQQPSAGGEPHLRLAGCGGEANTSRIMVPLCHTKIEVDLMALHEEKNI